MKKTISVILSLVMLFALCVPAFAVIDKNTVTAGNGTAAENVIVKTAYAEGQNPSDLEKYTVSFPAEVSVTWGNTGAVSAAYTVKDLQLQIGAKITVSVAAQETNQAGGAVMQAKDAASGKLYELPYTLTGAAAQEFSEYIDSVGQTSQTQVAVPSFENVPLAEYSGHLVYTVAYVAPAPGV